MNALVQAIATLLDESFGYEVYTDEIKMGFKSPSFFIEVINSRHSWINSKRYKMQVYLNIYYFPDITKASINEQILTILERLYALLDVFKGHKCNYRGLSMNHRQNDDFLVFSLNVNYHIKSEMPEEYMGNLDHDIATINKIITSNKGGYPDGG